MRKKVRMDKLIMAKKMAEQEIKDAVIEDVDYNKDFFDLDIDTDILEKEWDAFSISKIIKHFGIDDATTISLMISIFVDGIVYGAGKYYGVENESLDSFE